MRLYHMDALNAEAVRGEFWVTHHTRTAPVNMQGAHIFDRDVLIVRRTQAAREHDIIIASL
jgi:hypothetical protein